MTSMYVVLESLVNSDDQPWSKFFDILQKKTGLSRMRLFQCFSLLLGAYLVFGYAAQLVCNLIGFLYPAYASLKALETPQKGDDTKWLTYWTVFSLFSILEFPSDILLSWFPFYWLFKCAFMVWLFMPYGANGSMILYETVIRRVFLKYVNQVDKVFAESGTRKEE